MDTGKALEAALARTLSPHDEHFIKAIAKGFSEVLAPMQRKLDHLQREIALLKVQQRGHAIREQVQAHESDDD